MSYCTVYLYGELAKVCEPQLKCEVKNFSSLFEILEVNYPEFLPYMVEAVLQGKDFSLRYGEFFLDDETIDFPVGSAKDIHFMPVAEGEGGGFGKILTGIAIGAFGLVTGGLGIPVSSFIMAGSAMVLQGFLGITKTPQTTEEDLEPKASNIFSSGVNTIEPGNPYPIVVGRNVFVKSQTLSYGTTSKAIYNDSDEDSD